MLVYPHSRRSPTEFWKKKADMSGYTFTYRALNRLIQGSSADQTKRAMVEIDRSMPDTFLQLQVHDETDSSVADCREARMIAGKLCENPTGECPRVDIEMGMNWGISWQFQTNGGTDGKNGMNGLPDCRTYRPMVKRSFNQGGGGDCRSQAARGGNGV